MLGHFDFGIDSTIILELKTGNVFKVLICSKLLATIKFVLSGVLVIIFVVLNMFHTTHTLMHEITFEWESYRACSMPPSFFSNYCWHQYMYAAFFLLDCCPNSCGTKFFRFFIFKLKRDIIIRLCTHVYTRINKWL